MRFEEIFIYLGEMRLEKTQIWGEKRKKSISFKLDCHLNFAEELWYSERERERERERELVSSHVLLV